LVDWAAFEKLLSELTIHLAGSGGEAKLPAGPMTSPSPGPAFAIACATALVLVRKSTPDSIIASDSVAKLRR